MVTLQLHDNVMRFCVTGSVRKAAVPSTLPCCGCSGRPATADGRHYRPNMKMARGIYSGTDLLLTNYAWVKAKLVARAVPESSRSLRFVLCSLEFASLRL
jgi:hypothetical protein